MAVSRADRAGSCCATQDGEVLHICKKEERRVESSQRVVGGEGMCIHDIIYPLEPSKNKAEFRPGLPSCEQRKSRKECRMSKQGVFASWCPVPGGFGEGQDPIRGIVACQSVPVVWVPRGKIRYTFGVSGRGSERVPGVLEGWMIGRGRVPSLGALSPTDHQLPTWPAVGPLVDHLWRVD